MSQGIGGQTVTLSTFLQLTGFLWKIAGSSTAYSARIWLAQLTICSEAMDRAFVRFSPSWTERIAAEERSDPSWRPLNSMMLENLRNSSNVSFPKTVFLLRIVLKSILELLGVITSATIHCTISPIRWDWVYFKHLISPGLGRMWKGPDWDRIASVLPC